MSKDIWEPFFAILPIILKREDGSWERVWLRKLERKIVFDNAPYHTNYGYRIPGENVDYTLGEVIDINRGR